MHEGNTMDQRIVMILSRVPLSVTHTSRTTPKIKLSRISVKLQTKSQKTYLERRGLHQFHRQGKFGEPFFKVEQVMQEKKSVVPLNNCILVHFEIERLCMQWYIKIYSGSKNSHSSSSFRLSTTTLTKAFEQQFLLIWNFLLRCTRWF